MRKPAPRQTLNEFIAEESGRDPAFGREFALAKEKVDEEVRVRKRLGRPPKTAGKARQMRFLAPASLAERIRKAAAKEHRTVSNWLAQAAEKVLGGA